MDTTTDRAEFARTYEPPLTQEGAPCVPGKEGELFPGVTGYAILSEDRIWIPVVNGNGNGQVGKFLDAVSKRCVFPTVISARLVGMLQRRGYVETEGAECAYWRLP